MKKRTLAFFIAVVFVITALASCGKQQESTTTPIASDEPTSQTAQATDPAYSEQTSAQTEPTTPAEPTGSTSENDPEATPKIVEMGLTEVARDDLLMKYIPDTPIDDKELYEFVFYGGGHDMYAFIEKYDVKYYKSYENVYFFLLDTGEDYREILYNKGGKNDGLYYDSYLIGFSDDAAEEKIKEVKVGDIVDRVVEADPTGYYQTRYLNPDRDSLNRHEFPFDPTCTYHYFSNGTIYEIKYRMTVVVERITVYYL